MNGNEGRPLSEIMNGETGMSRSKTSKRTLIAEERRKNAIELRKAGISYQRIADTLGTTPSNVHKMVCKSLDLIREHTDENAQEVRTLELQRLDKLFQHAYSAVINGDTRAIDQALRCMERRAKILGIDAPSKVAQTDAAGRDLEGWQRIQAVVLEVLEPHPQIKSVLIDRLLQEGK